MQPPNPEKPSERKMKKAKSLVQAAFALMNSAKDDLTEELTTIKTEPLTVETNQHQMNCITDISLCEGILPHLRGVILTLESNGK